MPPLCNLAPSASAALSPHPRLQTSYPPFAHSISSPSAPPPSSFAPDFSSALPASTPPDSLRVLQWNAGGLRARNTELLHFLSSHPVDLICIQESNLNPSSSFRIPGFSALCSDRTHSRSGILSSDTKHCSGGDVIFVRQVLSFSELSTSSLSLLDPHSNYVGINISLNNSSSVSFLNGSFLLTSSPSMTLTHPPFSIAPLAVAPLLTSPLSPLLLHFLTPGRCYGTLVLSTYQFFYLSLFLQSFAPTSAPLPSIFRKLAGMVLPPTLTLTVPQQRNTRLFFFPLLLLSLPLWH